MKHLFIWLIRFYRKRISPLKRPCCRFSPTCSEYALIAYTKRGAFAGTVLTLQRILRCNPFGKPGYDPVPLRGLRSRVRQRDIGEQFEEKTPPKAFSDLYSDETPIENDVSLSDKEQ